MGLTATTTRTRAMKLKVRVVACDATLYKHARKVAADATAATATSVDVTTADAACCSYALSSLLPGCPPCIANFERGGGGDKLKV